MNHSARVLAARSAPLAAAYCDQIRDMLCTTIAGLSEGRAVEALSEFERALGPMEKMLVFCVVAKSMLQDAQHPLRRDVDAFARSLTAALEHADAALIERDFEALQGVLAATILPTLERYAAVGPRLACALEPRLAA